MDEDACHDDEGMNEERVNKEGMNRLLKECTMEELGQFRNTITKLKSVCKSAALEGDLEAIICLHDIKYPFDDTLSEKAASNGHLHILKWQREHQIPFSDNIECYAVCAGLETFIWVWNETVCEEIDDSILEAVACKGSIDIFEWLEVNEPERIKECKRNGLVCAFAAGEGQFETLKWLREHGYQWNFCSATYAASGGHLAILQWVLENGGEWCSIGYELIIKNSRSLECLQWLLEKGYPINRLKCIALAHNVGAFEIEKWLTETKDCSGE